MTPRAAAPTTLRPTLGLAGLGLVALAAPDGAQAQEPAAEAPAILPELRVQGQGVSGYRPPPDQTMPRSPVPIEQMPQSVSVITREVMQERANTTVRDALRNVTGISLAAGEGGFSGDNLTLRGFSARGDFYIDGLRDLGQYTRDSFFLESIEVLKGPSSVMFGRGSTGGVINQTTRMPLPTTQGTVWLSGYTPGGVRGTTDVNVRAGTVAARMVAMGSHIDAAGRDHVFQQRWGVFPSITLGMGTPTTLTLSYLHQEERNMPDYGVPYYMGRPLRVSTNTFYGLRETDRESTSVDMFTARLEHRFNDAILLRNTFRWAEYGRDISATAPRMANATAPITAASLINRQPQVRNGLDTYIVNQTEGVLNFNTGSWIRHNALVGFEVARESSELTRYSQSFSLNGSTFINGRPQANLLFPNFDDALPNLRTVPNSDIKTVANTYAFYAMDQMQLGRYFELLLGLRYDNFEARQVNRTNAQRFGRTDDAWSWRAALVFKPVEGVRTYFAYGTSFNPSAESLTLAANNAQLPPETNRSFELGGSWEVMPGLRLTSSIFRIEKTNARTSDPAADVLQVLDGVVRVDGFEISAVGRITPEWNLLAGYTYLNSEIVESRNPAEVGKRFANVAPNTVSVWSTYNLPWDLQLGAGATYVDVRYGNTTNTVRAPAYLRWDAALAWTPSEGPLRGIRLQANALNLGDARTYDTVYTGHVVPGIGRTFVFSMAASF